MARAFAFGFGVAFALAAFRNVPPLEEPTTSSAVVLILLALYAAFRAGRDIQRRNADARVAAAAASARAEVSADLRAMAAARSEVTVNLPGSSGTRYLDDDELVQLYADETGVELDPAEVRALFRGTDPVQAPRSEPARVLYLPSRITDNR